jgi:hypothetical protein
MNKMTPKNTPWIVITSINPPTAAIRKISDLCTKGWSAVVVGDTKTPIDWQADNINFLSVDEQKSRYGELADLIPYRHYCRKNMGYLYAIENGATLILDTDDDNIPLEGFGLGIREEVTGRMVGGTAWLNVYKHFSSDNIWPRGLPLNRIHDGGVVGASDTRHCVVQQFLADRDPDIDAIHRLVFGKEVFFDAAPPVILEEGTWCPFNSQNTVFFPAAFPLLYLPCHVSFRMTDIWRSFVALAILERAGGALAFLAPTVEQVRNEHDLMDDFELEVVGYRFNDAIRSVLRQTLATKSVTWQSLPEAVLACMTALVGAGHVPEIELVIVRAWLSALLARQTV